MGKVKNMLTNQWESDGENNDGSIKCNLGPILKEMNLTQKDIADSLGYTSGYISYVCNGYLPTLKVAFLMGNFLNKKIEEIWIFDSKIAPLFRQIVEARRILNNLQKQLNTTLQKETHET